MIEAIQAKPFALVTYAFINNTLSNNFDRYLSDVLSEACVFASKENLKRRANQKYDGDHRKGGHVKLQVIEEMVQDEDTEDHESRNIYDDIRQTIENLYPQRQTTSRFSIHNPHARFSQNPDQLRQIIKEFKEIGKMPNNVQN